MNTVTEQRQIAKPVAVNDIEARTARRLRERSLRDHNDIENPLVLENRGMSAAWSSRA
jgi:hypothetical protein